MTYFYGRSSPFKIMHWLQSSIVQNQQAHGVYTTSHVRCNVMTLQRRSCDLVHVNALGAFYKPSPMKFIQRRSNVDATS